MANKTKYAAGISLGAMAAGFAATIPFAGNAAVSILKSGFEAGLVGGLADWFAVTALFRHPLGIPIPHTALLPRNRSKVTNALVATIENELLNKASLIEKIRHLRLTEQLLQTLRQSSRTEAFQSGLVSILRSAVDRIPVEPLASWAVLQVKEAVDKTDKRRLFYAAIEQAFASGLDEKAFDFLLDKADEAIRRPDIRNRIGAMAMGAIESLQMGGFMQFAVNAFIGYLNEEKLGGMIQSILITQIAQLKEPHNPNRETILDALRAGIRRADDDQALVRKLERWIGDLTDKWVTEERLGGFLENMLIRVRQFLDDPANTERYLMPFLDRLLESGLANEAFLARTDALIQEQIANLIERNHPLIGKLVRENIDKLSNESLIELLEEKVGSDLQWIRVNGAICGFAIGIVLGLVQLAF